MATGSQIDPDLQYSSHSPDYAVLDALKRAQRGEQQPSHNPRPQQPYYLPHSSQPPQGALPAHGSFDPALDDDEDESPVHDDSSAHPSPLDIGTAHSSGSVNRTAADIKRSRACDSCRGLKVKCDFGNALPGEPCKRCAKARRPCVVTPATRRRQRKADTRVAELERKVDALTARLAEKGGGHVDVRPATEEYPEYNASSKRSASPLVESGLQYREQERLERGSPEKRRRLERHGSRDAQMRREDSGAIGADVHPQNGGISGIYNQTRPIIFDHTDVDRQISQVVDTATAERLFNRYLTRYMPRFPAVAFPPGTDADTVRKTKPILFLAILSSTCYGASIPADTQMALEMALRDVLADCLWKKGEKSLEIIQSLQVATLWYRPPANFEQHMFYQMVHVSAFMAIDIGIGKRMPPERRRLLGKHWPRRGVPDPESAEVRRAWLTSYFLCTSISMILRRPILFRFTDYARECLEYLETAEDALASDKLLCQHVRFARICEEIAVQFALDDPAVSLSISDGKVTYGIKHFEKDLAEIVAKPVTDHGLKLTEHVTSLYLHEIALHSQNNVEDFKTPFTEETFKSAASQTVLGPHHVDALTACNSACHEILDTFLSYDFEILFTLPVVFSVRCIYAVVVLIKLYIAANSPGELSNIINMEELHVEEYIKRMRETFQSFMDRDSQSPHSKFLYVMERLRARFQDILRGDVAEAAKAVKVAAATASAAVRAPQGDVKQNPGKAAQQPALGLHALSEAAMIGNQQQQQRQQQQQQQQQQAQQAQAQAQQNNNGNIMTRQHHGQPTPQGWYQPQGDMAQMPMDPQAYQYPQHVPISGFENFDYGLGGLGMGMDGAISGLFMADGLWNYNEPQPGLYPGWG